MEATSKRKTVTETKTKVVTVKRCKEMRASVGRLRCSYFTLQLRRSWLSFNPSRPSQKHRKLPGVFRHWPAQTSVWHSSTSDEERGKIQKWITRQFVLPQRGAHGKTHERAQGMRFPRAQTRGRKTTLETRALPVGGEFGTLPTLLTSLLGHGGCQFVLGRCLGKVCLPLSKNTALLINGVSPPTARDQTVLMAQCSSKAAAVLEHPATVRSRQLYRYWFTKIKFSLTGNLSCRRRMNNLLPT